MIFRHLSPYHRDRTPWRRWPSAIRRWRKADCAKPERYAPSDLVFCTGFPRNHILQEHYE